MIHCLNKCIDDDFVFYSNVTYCILNLIDIYIGIEMQYAGSRYTLKINRLKTKQ